MNKLFDYADEFLNRSDWKDLALIKFCLCAIGVILGITLPKMTHKTTVFIAGGIFIATYIPLMLKLLKVIRITERRER